MITRTVKLGQGQICYQAEVWAEWFELRFYECEHGAVPGSMGQPGETVAGTPVVTITGPMRSVQTLIDTLLEAKQIHRDRFLKGLS